MIRLVTVTRFAWMMFVALVALSGDVHAQHDSRGQIFWITFMSNWGSGAQRSDLRLYLAADTPTTVRIVYFGERDPLRREILVDIPEARKSVEVDISGNFGWEVELDLWEEFAPKAIQVIVDDSVEVSCYGVNIRGRSADAFLALPDDVLTRTYIVLAYPNAIANMGGYLEYDQPSQFAVVATEDGTRVDVKPSARVNGRTLDPYSIALNRGEVYNAQADLGYSQDVSGTELRSNKPIAVFGGNRRTAIPTDVGNFRDHLVEQIPPLEIWGREAIVTPHYPITLESSQIAVVRVLAAFDNTTWQVNGVDSTPLMRAQSVEIPLTGAMSITASGPILVAQYEHSVDSYDPQQRPLPGDPFMMIIPPTEQFAHSYSFQAVDHPEFVEYGHFTNVVVPTAAIGSVLLDDAPPVNATWRAVPLTRYSYAQVHIEPGSHHISADSAFGIYSYGYGPASSYGYPGGMLFKTLVHDFQPPNVRQNTLCGGAQGFAYDNEITDSGIDSIYMLPTSRNVNVQFDPFARGADTVHYRAQLVDPFSDGIVAVKAIDTTGRSGSRTHDIPGFTVRASGASGSVAMVLDTLKLFNGRGGCVTIVLENHGKFPQSFASVEVVPANPTVTTDAPTPIRLAPGERIAVKICATGMPDTLVNASIVLIGDCSERMVAMLPIEAGTDSTPPAITSSDVSCNRDVVLTLSDIVAKYSQINAISFDTLINARIVQQTPTDLATPATFVEVRLTAPDQFQDMIYQVRCIDVAGNVRVRRDTVGGFTLSVLDDVRDSVSQRFERDISVQEMLPGENRCDSVLIVNYGTRAVTLTQLSFNGNRTFSVPPAQLPFVIAPHSERRLQVCVEALATGHTTDTMRMVDACGRTDGLIINSRVAILATEDDCNSALSVTSLGAAKRTFIMTPHPNPSDGTSAAIDIGLARDASITFEVLDAKGMPASSVMRGVGMRAGLHRVAFDVSTLGNGTYFCRMRTATGEQFVEKLVILR